MRVARWSEWAARQPGPRGQPQRRQMLNAITSPRSRRVVVLPEFRKAGWAPPRRRDARARARFRAGHRRWSSGGLLGQPPAAVPGPLDHALPGQLLEAFVDPGLGAADGVGELGDPGAPRAGGVKGSQQRRQWVAVAGVLGERRRRLVRGFRPLRMVGSGAPFG